MYLDFLFGAPHGADHSHHPDTAFGLFSLGASGLPSAGRAPVAGATAGMPAAGTSQGAAAGGSQQYQGDVVKPIDVKAEVARINDNILIFQWVMAASAVGMALTTCLFVRSIFKPAKGYESVDSDDDEDDDDDDDDESDD